MAKADAMTFERIGRSHHLRIETAADLKQVVELDEAHWVATNAPTDTINCDSTFLRLLDSDGNGRITSRELTDAILWTGAVLCENSGITARETSLQLSAIDPEHEDGQRILQAAQKIISRSSAPETDQITLEQVRKVKADTEAMPISEAGVVLPEASEDSEIGQFITDAISVTGGTVHPSGASGIGVEQLTEFLSAVSGDLEWRRAGELPPGQSKTDIMPLGRDTADAYEVLAAVRGKIDQYFAQCEAVALDERFVQRMGWTEDELQGLDFDDPGVIEEVLTKAPLAKARRERELHFGEPVNPHYADLLERFRGQVTEAVLPERCEKLSVGQWRQIKSTFAAHEAYLSSRGSPAAAALDTDKLEAYLDDRFAGSVRALIAESANAALVLDNIRLVEKLMLYQGNLINLANNFVSFPHLYSEKHRAMFEMGTLVMDGRRFNLAVKCDDCSRHAELAKASNMYVLYVEVTPGGKDSYKVAIPVTSGDKGNLCVGKRGVFHDVSGRQCDARVLLIIENPICLREALWSPFKRLGRLLTGKIESLTTQAEKKLDTQASAAVSQVASGTEPAARPPTSLAAGGMIMGAGVAVAALGSAFAYVAKTIAEAGYLPIIIAILGAVVLVALPTSIVAFLKLRKRALSAILEASGWAINSRMRLTRSQRHFFTQRPGYPKGSKGVHRPAALLLGLLLLIAIIGVTAYLLKARIGVPMKPTSVPAVSSPKENR